MGEKGRSGRDAGDEDPLRCKSRKYGVEKEGQEKEPALIRLETKAVDRFARGSTTLLALQHLMFGAEFQQNMDSLCSQCEGIGRTKYTCSKGHLRSFSELAALKCQRTSFFEVTQVAQILAYLRVRALPVARARAPGQ